MERRVVITRMGVISPIGNSIDEFTDKLYAGRSGITTIKQSDWNWFIEQKDFPHVAAKVNEPDLSGHPFVDQISKLPTAARYVIEAFDQLDIGTLVLDEDRGIDFGISIGTVSGSIKERDEALSRLVSNGQNGKVPPTYAFTSIPSYISTSLALYLSGVIHRTPLGFASTHDAACASSGIAIGEAYQKIKYGQIKVAICGGTEAMIVPTCLGGMNSIRILSRGTDETAAKPFDKERDGLVMGEGAGLVVLEDYDHVASRGGESDIIAELCGYGATNDATNSNRPFRPDPNGEGIYQALCQAIRDSGLGNGNLALAQTRVGYVNASATSTKKGDASESRGIERALGNQPYVSSVKPLTGHPLGASGVLGVITAALSLKRQEVPFTQNLKNPGDDVAQLNYVMNETQSVLGLEYAAMSCTGFGGHNAAILLRKNV